MLKILFKLLKTIIDIKRVDVNHGAIYIMTIGEEVDYEPITDLIMNLQERFSNKSFFVILAKEGDLISLEHIHPELLEEAGWERKAKSDIKNGSLTGGPH
ncbi:hypothetical protein LCGC14_0805390 [marine sediment metagenome]|uniref:Uncharacterized protein n=1 Tax=marine sediment metagenome TaxID=412755 RepID=A0A0F9PSX3_9ZZZZ